MATKQWSIGDGARILRERFRGEILMQGDDSYDETRSIWNGMIDRKPGLIARPTGTADVVTAVNFARENDILVAVKGGGHNIAGNAVCEGGLMIILEEMNSVRVDQKERTVRVEGGATMGDLDHETQEFGLATPGGVVSTTGVAGLTLGGGLGWLARKYGLAIDNLRSVDVVTADGQVRTASEDEHSDLFWAIRGGSGNFGIVTSFEFDLHAVGPDVLFGPTVYPFEDADGVLRNYREFARDAPRECCIWVDSVAAPPLPFLPEDVHGTTVLLVVQFYTGNLEEGERVLAPLREYGDPIADAVAPTQYTEAQSRLDDLYVEGARNYWKANNFTELTDETIGSLIEQSKRFPSLQSELHIHQVGGATNDVAADETAYPHRDAEFLITVGARWEDPTTNDICIEWVRDTNEALASEATGGTYVNFEGEREGRERNAYGTNYDRLVELKTKYDPTNLFRMNQNIDPSS